jgi:hypothetical protein
MANVTARLTQDVVGLGAKDDVVELPSDDRTDAWLANGLLIPVDDAGEPVKAPAPPKAPDTPPGD